MRTGNLNKEHDKKLVSILKHYIEVSGDGFIHIDTNDLSRVGLDELSCAASLERAEKRNLLRIVSIYSLEDATYSEREKGVALVAKVVYYPKGRRRQKGPIKMTGKVLFNKGGFAVCEDMVGDVGIFYNRRRLYIGNKPDQLLAFLLKNNGKCFTKHEIAESVFNTHKVGNISELVRRINNTVATYTKQNLTKIIKKPRKTKYMTDL